MDYILFIINEHYFAAPIQMVIEVCQIPQITKIPASPDWQRGVIEFRSQMIPVLDIRYLLHMTSLSDNHNELIKLLNDRQQDHINWITELDASVKDKRPFTLTTDPHSCKFGKWYDNYKTHDRTLTQQLIRFDTPHKRIHSLGVAVQNLASQEKWGEAQRMVDQARATIFSGLLEIFDQTKQILSKAEEYLALVIQIEQTTLAIPIDHIDRSVNIPPNKVQGRIAILEEGKCAHIFGPKELESWIQNYTPNGKTPESFQLSLDKIASVTAVASASASASATTATASAAPAATTPHHNKAA